MAQWKSVPFTPERSLVRSQLGPLYTPNRITRGWGFCDVAAHIFHTWTTLMGVY